MAALVKLWREKQVLRITGKRSIGSKNWKRSDILLFERYRWYFSYVLSFAICSKLVIWQPNILPYHAAQRVFVVFEQLPYCLRAMDSRVVRVEAEQVVFFFDSCMQGPAVPAKADREDKVVLCRVSQQEASFRLVREQLFSLVPVDLAPVEGAVDDFPLWKQKCLNQNSSAFFFL